MDSRMVCCTESKGRKGTNENKKMRVGGMASKKLKDMAAARSFRRKSLILLMMIPPMSYKLAPCPRQIFIFLVHCRDWSALCSN